MTGNQIKGKGFRGALRYNLKKVEKNLAEVLDHSFALVNEKSIMKEIQMVKILRPNLQKFFYHTSINFPPQESISNEIMTKIAHDYLQANGFNQHQFIIFRHYDANHPHLHILVNRIGYDGKVLSDSNDFARSEKVLRELEKKYNLTPVISSKQASKRATTKDELEMIKRTSTPSSKMQLQRIISEAIKGRSKPTCSEFIQLLEKKGVTLLFNQATTGYVSGISYSYEGIIITGAKLGNDFKWTTIKDKIDYAQERDRQSIVEANARTKTIRDDIGRTNTTLSTRRNREGGESANEPATGQRKSILKPEGYRRDDIKVLKVLEFILDSDQGNTVEPVNPSHLNFASNRRRKRRKRGRRI